MVPQPPGNFGDEMRAGFMHPKFDFHVGGGGGIRRAEDLTQEANALIARLNGADLKRVDVTGDLMGIAHQLGGTLSQIRSELTRAVTTGTSGFPIRENLEAPAKILVPTQTPLRNMLPRVPGSGLSAAWRQQTSLGGGYGYQTTVTTGTASATQTVGNTAGFRAGDVVYFATANVSRTISSITSATVLVLTATVTTTTGETMTNTSLPVGAGAGALSQTRAFFSESGAPADHTPAWAPKTATYKLLGATTSITGLAAAAGRSYDDAYASLKRSLLLVTMLNEEAALLNGNSTAITPPWGDGTNALAYDGLRNLVTSANGVPAANIQVAVGGLTLTALDTQLVKISEAGGTGNYLIMAAQEILSLTHLAEAAGSIIRVQATVSADAVLGMRVTAYKHPLSGEMIPVIYSRYLVPGEILFGSEFSPDGSAAAEVDVLPQFPLANLNLDGTSPQMIQGYTVMDIAPDITSPHVFAMVCALYSVLKLKNALVWAKSSGVTAV